MKKLNEQAFTLIELLVAISIMGIILIIALPQVSNIQNHNQETKYKKYAETLIASAKLYIDSYEEDIFVDDKTCETITYEKLKEKNLVKNIKIDEADCSNEDTFVNVTKEGVQYTYEVSLYCINADGNELYNGANDIDPCS